MQICKKRTRFRALLGNEVVSYEHGTTCLWAFS